MSQRYNKHTHSQRQFNIKNHRGSTHTHTRTPATSQSLVLCRFFHNQLPTLPLRLNSFPASNTIKEYRGYKMRFTWFVCAILVSTTVARGQHQQQQQQNVVPRSSKDAPSRAVERCIAASEHMARTSREMRKLFIPAVNHPQGARTLSQKAGCLVTNTGWWTYEFCFGDFIRQFHEENGVVVDENIIGLSGHALEKDSLVMGSAYNYKTGGPKRFLSKIRVITEDDDESLDPNLPQYGFKCAEDLTPILRNKKEGAVVVTHYDKGSLCGADTDKRRSATVFMICDSTLQPDPTKRVPIFFDIAETSPCEYQLFVRGDSMCSIMNMIPPAEVASTVEGSGSVAAAAGGGESGTGTTKGGKKRRSSSKKKKITKSTNLAENKENSNEKEKEVAEGATAQGQKGDEAKESPIGTSEAPQHEEKQKKCKHKSAEEQGTKADRVAIDISDPTLLVNDPRTESFEKMPEGLDQNKASSTPSKERENENNVGDQMEEEEETDTDDGDEEEGEDDTDVETEKKNKGSDEVDGRDSSSDIFSSSYYPKGLDDPAFYEDSFIMSL